MASTGSTKKASARSIFEMRQLGVLDHVLHRREADEELAQAVVEAGLGRVKHIAHLAVGRDDVPERADDVGAVGDRLQEELTGLQGDRGPRSAARCCDVGCRSCFAQTVAAGAPVGSARPVRPHRRGRCQRRRPVGRDVQPAPDA